MIGLEPVMAELICSLSEQRQTTIIELTITPAKYTHVANLDVRVCSVSSTNKLIIFCLKFTPGAPRLIFPSLRLSLEAHSRRAAKHEHKTGFKSK